MPRTSILSDEFVRQLVAVGQVDILVGIPTHQHASTIQAVVQSVHTGLARRYPRERTVLIGLDGGSEDGTPELVRTARLADEELAGSPTLRTTHRITGTYPGMPGNSAGVRMVFAAADLLQARAVVLVDAAASNPQPGWVPDLVEPVWRGGADLAVPVRPRRRLDGTLLSQLLQPLLGAVYGPGLHVSLGGDFACTGAFAARMVGHVMWERELPPPACDLWLLTSAMVEPLRFAHVPLGERILAPRPGAPGLAALFEQVVGTAFDCLEYHAGRWSAIQVGEEPEPPGHRAPTIPESAQLELGPMVDRFRAGVRDLDPLLRDILSPDALAGLHAAAAGGEVHELGDELWANTVYEFVIAAHRGLMSRAHLAQTLLPLYLGRTASIATELADVGEPAYSDRMRALEREFVRMRPSLLQRWQATLRR